MIKNFLALFLSVLGIPALKAQEKSLLWEISGKEIQSPSYLYGTIHLVCEQDLNISPGIINAVKSSKVIYLEIDIDDPEMYTKMAPHMMLHGDTTLQMLFGDDYPKVSRFFSENVSINLEQVKKFRPFSIMSLIISKLANCKKTTSYENIFSEMAKQQHKNVEGLETVESQLEMLNSIPDSSYCRQILATIEELPKQKASFSRLLDAYKKQDIDALYQLGMESPDMKGFEDILLTRRNKNWIPVIEEITKSQSAFIAVGAMHLGGPQGVIRLLREAGYTVNPVIM
ncbi:TraB/GumN family protein [Chitinophaga caeni]|uniref:TraB/GumN family protein n=1 Tax=Chitinophaga caeni TaxID=2029983 RepID=A0A291QVV5_9BACT|nr:TraB/GumN family protein [Chitinophaga caeni]ATL48096.1 TraB/GumN family protein [Chitinophaga caeni]